MEEVQSFLISVQRLSSSSSHDSKFLLPSRTSRVARFCISASCCCCSGGETNLIFHDDQRPRHKFSPELTHRPASAGQSKRGLQAATLLFCTPPPPTHTYPFRLPSSPTQSQKRDARLILFFVIQVSIMHRVVSLAVQRGMTWNPVERAVWRHISDGDNGRLNARCGDCPVS